MADPGLEDPGADENADEATAVRVPVDPDTREVTVRLDDQRKPVSVSLATPGVSVEIEAPEPLDVVAARALALWHEIHAAPPPVERVYGFGASGAGQHEVAFVEEVSDGGDVSRVPGRPGEDPDEPADAGDPAQAR